MSEDQVSAATPSEPGPIDPKEAMRLALERKHNRNLEAHAQAQTDRTTGRPQAAAASKRQFRRKSGS